MKGTPLTEDLKTRVLADYRTAKLTQKQIAEKHNLSLISVTRIVRTVPDKRQPITPTQKGKAKKLNVSYYALHARVRAARGAPQYCAKCDSTDPNVWYEWANLTGNYEDLTDYIRLCRRCHVLFDETWKNLPALNVEATDV